MVELLLKRYLWLIDTLKRNGEMTFDEIAERWEESSLNDNGSVLTKRTFFNHCQAVARHFGIDIECRRGRGLNLYSIVIPEAIEENTLTKWAVDNFSLGELLLLLRDQLEVLSSQSLRNEIQEITTKMKNIYDE